MAKRKPLVLVNGELRQWQQYDSWDGWLLVEGDTVTVRKVGPALELESPLGIYGGGQGWAISCNLNDTADYGMNIMQWNKAAGALQTRLAITDTTFTYNGSTVYTNANHGSTGDPHTQYLQKPTGTTGQFLRGDGTASSTLTADMRVQKGVPGYEMVSANGQNGWRFIGNVNDTSDFGFVVGQLVSGSWTSRYSFSTVAMAPSSDNTLNSGRADARWKEVFAGASAINTSDGRHKTPVRKLTAQEIAAAIALADEIGIYQMLEAIAEKGEEEARLHAGMTVQRAIAVMESHGLDAMRYSFICYDSWEEQPEIRRYWPFEPRVVDDFGNLIREQVEAGSEVAQEYRAAGDLYSFRMSPLLAFIAAGERAARLAAQEATEARLAALERALGLE